MVVFEPGADDIGEPLGLGNEFVGLFGPNLGSFVTYVVPRAAAMLKVLHEVPRMVTQGNAGGLDGYLVVANSGP